MEAEGEDTAAPEAQAEEAGRYSPTPGVRITRTRARGAVDQLGTDLEGPPIEAAFNGVPIVAFINEVFGTELGMSFVISPGLQEKTDLVTLPEVLATHRTVFQLAPLHEVPVNS